MKGPCRFAVLAVFLGAASCRAGGPATPVDGDRDEGLPAEEERRSEDVEAALAGLFGATGKPSFRVLPEWEGEGFDPNAPGAWLDVAARSAVHEDNRRRYGGQLKLVEQGDLAAVQVPPDSEELEQRWRALLARPDSAERTADARKVFLEHVPSLRDSARRYRRACVNCHGSDGGGNGPTAAFLDPAPRDYRQGEFKFTTLLRPASPTRDDLARVIHTGITGTAMPAFDMFTLAQLQGLVDYVSYLSMRGETELLLLEDWDVEEGLPAGVVEGDYRLVVERWRSEKEDLRIPVPPIPAWSPERVERGRALFLDEQGANCARCHGEDGRGHGVAAFAADESEEERPLLRDDWGHPIRPRDLTKGIFRFGSTPQDNYVRIHAGIRGTPMPGHFGMWVRSPKGGELRQVDGDDIWDLVFFVRSLSAQRPL